VPWNEALLGILVPHITWSTAFATTLVAIFGTTISPYLFFWQASQEAEDERVDHHAKPLKKAPEQAPREFERIRADTLIGMAFSNVIALSIIVTTATALNKAGITNVETSAQAAEALRPIAGAFAFVLFALGIIGTGLLAALYWAAVINGVVAVPVMSVMMVMTAQRKIMGKFVVIGWLRWLGWASTAAMAACVGGMIVSWVA
jgi:Mn2+/Fe2+ NRAMP family transporter